MISDLETSTFLVNMEAEKTVISAILQEPDLLDACFLEAEMFGPAKHQRIFQIIKSLKEKSLPVELVAIVEEAGMESLDTVGGLTYLSELSSSFYSSSSFGYHQELIAEYYRKRQIAKQAQTVLENVYDHSSDDLINQFNGRMEAIQKQEVKSIDDYHISKVLKKTYDWIETEHDGEVTGAPTGLTDLDAILGGLQRQDLIIIGARPSVGKTALAMNICKNYSSQSKGVTAVFSLEMEDVKLALRMISESGHIDGNSMKNPQKRFSSDDWVKAAHAMAELGAMPMYVFDEPNVDIGYIRRNLRSLKAKYPDEHIVVMIDYLQLIKGDPAHKGNKNQEIGEISKSLKNIARELDLSMVALSQLSRKLEERADKRPMLSDLRESGQIEQDADVIAFLYREDYYDKDSESAGITEVIVAKQRNGPTGTVELVFLKEYSKFVNLQK